MTKLMVKSFKRGDTIVEVLFALAAFGFVAMAAMIVMQQGSHSAQLSLEINVVRNQMNSQAEAIRFINAAAQARERDVEAGDSSIYSQLWQRLVAKASGSSNSVSDWSSVTVNGPNGRVVCAEIPPNAFILDVKNLNSGIKDGATNLQPAKVFSRLVYREDYDFDTNDGNAISTGDIFDKSEGMWIQVEKADSNSTSTSYDFHIRSCWESPGKSQPIKLGTIVRVHMVKERS